MVGRPFEKGEHRTGRAKGTPNKATQTMRELLEAETGGVPLPVILLRKGLQVIDDGMVVEGAKMINDACKYGYATMKAVEHSGEIKTSPVLQIVRAPRPEEPPAPIDAL